MIGDRDPFDFMLAKDLGLTLAQVRQMDHAEYVEWRAFYTFQRGMDVTTWR